LDKSYNINDNRSISKDKSILNFKRIFVQKQIKNNCSAKSITLEKIFLFIKDKNNKKKTDLLIKFSCFDIIKYLFCGKRFKDENFLNQEKIHIHVERKINGYLNILKLMKLFENFKRLKKLILNNHQICIFENSKKRIWTDIYKDKIKSLFELSKYFKGNKKLTRFRNIIPDDKLKILLDQDLKNLLNL